MLNPRENVADDESNRENPPSMISNYRKRKYCRHSPHTIQNLLAIFKEFPNPNEEQISDIGTKFNIEFQKVKFWFQNRRTQMKIQLEKQENNAMIRENDKLLVDNNNLRMSIITRDPTFCRFCGNQCMIEEFSLDEQHLRRENAYLEEEIDRAYSIAGRSLVDHQIFISSSVNGELKNERLRTLYIQIAVKAMDELVKLAKSSSTDIWTANDTDFIHEKLNYEKFLHAFPSCIGPKPQHIGFVSEGTRASAIIMANSNVIVETLMDVDRWVSMFPCSISKASTINVLSNIGVSGTKDNALQLMKAELQVLSPLVPIREVIFLRFCKMIAEGVWAVVDTSIDESTYGTIYSIPKSSTGCWKFPSGCVIEDFSNGQSKAKVIWVEHIMYNEYGIHEVHDSLMRSGAGLGANKWLSTLKRQCETLAFLMSTSSSPDIGIMGHRSLLKLVHRMTNSFYKGVCPSVNTWTMLSSSSSSSRDTSSNIKLMMRKIFNSPGEPIGVVLNGATSLWLPVSHACLMKYLQDVSVRNEWDILINGGPMHVTNLVPKGWNSINHISIIRPTVCVDDGRSDMVIVQETSTDESGSLMVYASMDNKVMDNVLNGGDSSYIALLPSGFSIVPNTISVDKRHKHGYNLVSELVESEREVVVGSIVTISLQILADSKPTSHVHVHSIESMKSLIIYTLEKIKAAMNC